MYFSFGISNQLIDSSRVLFDSFRQPQSLDLFQNRSVAGMYMRVGVVSVGMPVAVGVCVMGMCMFVAVGICVVGMCMFVAVGVCIVEMCMFVAVCICIVGMLLPVAVSVCIVGMLLLKVMSICTVCVDVLRQLCVLLRMDVFTGNRAVCMCMRNPLLLPVDGHMHMCAGNAAFFHGFRCDFNPVWGKSLIHGL